MTNSLNRRRFLGASVLSMAALPMESLFALPQTPFQGSGLISDPSKRLDLPKGFQYRILSRSKDPMTDGYLTPGRPDGMGCFAGPNGTLILMRNHENDFLDGAQGPYKSGQTPPPEAYNKLVTGGVTRVVLDRNLNVLSSNLVLIGTARNCAGGVSPWGWLTCEETVVGQHGYVFLCDPFASKVQPYQRLPQLGKFYHEAACVDPATNAIYLTEDRGDSCFYRFLPWDPSSPFEGRLQALVLNKGSVTKTTTLSRGALYQGSWVDLDDVDSKKDDLRARAQRQGAAIFSRGEGMWYHDSKVYFTCTTGGSKGIGQVMCLDVSQSDTPEFQVFAECKDKSLSEKVDSITVSPRGDVFVGEDGDGDNFIRVVTQAGDFRDFARTPKDEICGVCFSPDASTLFFNLQRSGLTMAVTGPFEEFLR
jgi:secreted PhoX family phosphatase